MRIGKEYAQRLQNHKWAENTKKWENETKLNVILGLFTILWGEGGGWAYKAEIRNYYQKI